MMGQGREWDRATNGWISLEGWNRHQAPWHHLQAPLQQQDNGNRQLHQWNLQQNSSRNQMQYARSPGDQSVPTIGIVHIDHFIRSESHIERWGKPLLIIYVF
jgi:hypothetical protein